MIFTLYEGEFNVNFLPEGNYRVSVAADGFAPVTAVISVTSGQSTSADFVLSTQGGNLELNAEDAQHTPVAGAHVIIRGKDGNLMANPQTNERKLTIFQTNKKGIFTLNNLSAGNYTGTLRKNGYKDTRFEFEIMENKNTRVSLAINK